jgi:hypothetical protein
MAFEGIGKKVAQPNTANGSADPSNPDAGLTDSQMFERRNNGINRTTGTVDTGISGQKEFHTYTTSTSQDPNYEANKLMVRDRVAQLDARKNQTMTATGAQGSTIATGPQNQMRDAQGRLIGGLENTIAGKGPSVAQEQLRQATDANIAGALAMAGASGTPGAHRAAAFQAAAANQSAAGQSASLRAQEIAQAQQTLGGVAQGARAQDIGLATDQAQMSQQNSQFNAGLAQDANKTNLLSGVEQQKQRDDLIRNYLAAGMTLDQANMQAEIQQKQFNAELLAKQEAAQIGVTLAGSAQNAQILGAGIGAAGTALAAGAQAASDKKLKKNVGDGEGAVIAFLDSLEPKTFDYRDEAKHGDGRRLGIMAQDAEKTPVGATFVFEAPEGKHLDLPKAASAMLASLAVIHQRLKKVEGK